LADQGLETKPHDASLDHAQIGTRWRQSSDLRRRYVLRHRNNLDERIELHHSPDVIVGVSGLPQTLSSNQLEVLTSVISGQDASVRKATFFIYTGENPNEALARLFRRDKGPDEKADLCSFSGKGKIGFEIPASAIRKVSTEVIVSTRIFDRYARLRDELLDGEIFYSLREAQIVIEGWRRHYNRISLVLRIVRCCLPQPKMHSIITRHD
jgi:hypothetical protein